MTATRYSIFSRTTTIGTADADPNTLLPALPAGITATSGQVEGAPFVFPEWYKNSASSALLLAMTKTTGGTSTATVSIWVFDKSVILSPGNGGTWVLMKAGQTITEGTPVVAPFIRGADYLIYIQVTGTTNTPTGLVGFAIPQP